LSSHANFAGSAGFTAAEVNWDVAEVEGAEMEGVLHAVDNEPRPKPKPSQSVREIRMGFIRGNRENCR
jgi:hypothetical protein